MVLACGIIGLVYVFYQNGFETISVKALVMAYVSVKKNLSSTAKYGVGSPIAGVSSWPSI